MGELKKYSFTLLILMSYLTACQQTSGEEVLRFGDEVAASLKLEQDSLYLPAEAEQAGLRITGERIRLDFGGAVLYGKAFGEAPDRQWGTAIRAGALRKLHLRDATFLGFRAGIEIGSVDTLILENCHFDHFYRDMDGAAASVALSVQRVGVLMLRGCHFQGLGQAVQMGSADQIVVDSCHFQWLNAVALGGDRCESAEVRHSTFFAIGTEDTGRPVLDIPGTAFQLEHNFLAQIDTDKNLRRDLLQNSNTFAYLPGLEAPDSSRAIMDRILLESGIPTPGLDLYDEWGWFRFSYPRAWYRQTRAGEDIYLLCAPPGNWRLIDGNGYRQVTPKTGTFPVTVRAERTNAPDSMFLQFEYLGKPLRRHGRLRQTTDPVTFRATPQ